MASQRTSIIAHVRLLRSFTLRYPQQAPLFVEQNVWRARGQGWRPITDVARLPTDRCPATFSTPLQPRAFCKRNPRNVNDNLSIRTRVPSGVFRSLGAMGKWVLLGSSVCLYVCMSVCVCVCVVSARVGRWPPTHPLLGKGGKASQATHPATHPSDPPSFLSPSGGC